MNWRKAKREPAPSVVRERAPGVFADRGSGHDSEIDWNSVLLGKKVLSEQDFADLGVEAPKSNLAPLEGNRPPKASRVGSGEAPHGGEIGKVALFRRLTWRGEFGRKKKPVEENVPIKTLMAQDSGDGEHERKRRSGPGVVARLMGLDALPDKLAKANPVKPLKSSRSKKDASPRPSAAESSGARPASSLHRHSYQSEMDSVKDFPLPQSRSLQHRDGGGNERAKIDEMASRAHHPQESQLQEFKREFMEKLTGGSKTGRGRTPVPSPGGDRELGEKRSLLREKLSEAKQVLASEEANESKRLYTAQEKLMESQEFQDAIHLLQTNKEFFKRFFPDVGAGQPFVGSKDPPEPEPEPEAPPRSSVYHFDDWYDEPETPERRLDEVPRKSCVGDFYKPSRKSSFMGDLQMEPRRKSYHHDDRRAFYKEETSKEARKASHRGSHGSPKRSSGRKSSRAVAKPGDYMDELEREIRALEDCLETDYVEDRGSNEREDSSPESLKQKFHSGRKSTSAVESLQPRSSAKGRYMDRDSASCAFADTVGGRQGSSNNLDSRRNCDSGDSIVLLRPHSGEIIIRPTSGEITLLAPAEDPGCSPDGFKIMRNARGSIFEAREVLLLDPKERLLSSPHAREEGGDSRRGAGDARDAKERGSPSKRESPQAHRDDHGDPREIARDVVSQVSTSSARRLSRDREAGRGNSKASGNRQTRFSGHLGGGSGDSSPPKHVPEVTEIVEAGISSSDESLNISALPRRLAMEERSRFTVPMDPSPNIGGSREPATSRFMVPQDSSPSIQRSGGPAITSEGQDHRVETEPRPSEDRVVNQIEEDPRRSLVHGRRLFGEAHELDRSPTISRPRGLPESIARLQLDGDDWEDADYNKSLPPITEKVLKVDSVHPTGHGRSGRDHSQGKSSRTMFCSWPIPNAGTADGARGKDSGSRGGSIRGQGQERMESPEQFYLKEERAEARQAYLFSMKRDGGRNATDSGRLRSPRVWPLDPTVAHHVYLAKDRDSSVPAEPDRAKSRKRSFRGDYEYKDSRARGNDYDVRKALWQGKTPKALSALHGGSDIARAGKLSYPGDFEAIKQGRKNSKECPAPESGDGDGASETSVDKYGQPSPVSVLDSPFEAQIAAECKELSSDIRDLRMRLLKLDGEKSAALLELEASKLPDYKWSVRQTENAVESTDSVGSSAASVSSTTFSTAKDLQCLVPSVDLGELLESLPCPDGKQDDLVYVQNVLDAAGFSENAAGMIGEWHSPTCPLDPCLYEQLEDYYIDADLKIALEHGNVKSGHGIHDSFHRRLVFDVVNEVVSNILGPYKRYQPWVRLCKPLLSPMPTSRQLVSVTWAQICTFFLPPQIQEFETLNYLTGRDVRGAPWLDSQEYYEQVGLEVEETIFESLIEDTVQFMVAQRDQGPPAGRQT